MRGNTINEKQYQSNIKKDSTNKITDSSNQFKVSHI